jgi:hypothetical protein
MPPERRAIIRPAIKISQPLRFISLYYLSI